MDSRPAAAELAFVDSRRARSRQVSGLEQQVAGWFLRLREPVYHYLLGILGDPGEAEDATQEAFLRLFTELDKGQQIDNVRAWVFHVGQNLAIDRRRRMARVQHVEERAWEEICDQWRDPAPDPQQALLRREQRRRLRALVAELPTQERRCMELRTAGLRYRDIAQVMGLRIPSVQTYLARAVRKIVRGLDV